MNLLAKTSPFQDVFFNDFFSPTLFSDNKSLNSELRPNVRIEDTNDSMKLYMELAGVDKKDVNITTENNTITISGKKEHTKSDNVSDNVQYNEMSYGEYKRSFKLSDVIDVNNISANMKNGILEIELGKKEKVKPRPIPIE